MLRIDFIELRITNFSVSEIIDNTYGTSYHFTSRFPNIVFHILKSDHFWYRIEDAREHFEVRNCFAPTSPTISAFCFLGHYLAVFLTVAENLVIRMVNDVASLEHSTLQSCYFHLMYILCLVISLTNADILASVVFTSQHYWN